MELANAAPAFESRIPKDSALGQELVKSLDDPLEFARTLRRLRLKIGKANQMDFAAKVDIRFSTYTQFEGGAIKKLTPQMLRRIMNELERED